MAFAPRMPVFKRCPHALFCVDPKSTFIGDRIFYKMFHVLQNVFGDTNIFQVLVKQIFLRFYKNVFGVTNIFQVLQNVFDDTNIFKVL